jgi:prepilin peptidase CpaA
MTLAALSAVQLAGLLIAIGAAVCDLRTRRIPNALTFGAAAAGLLFHALSGGLTGTGLSALGWLLGALVFIVPFALRGLGGGDVKLLAALGAWIGPWEVLWLALYTGIAGAVIAVIVAIARGYLRRALANVWLLLCHWRVAGLTALPEITLEQSTAPKLAYAVPILAGMVAIVWLR